MDNKRVIELLSYIKTFDGMDYGATKLALDKAIESIEKLEKINELLVGEKESEDKLSYCDLENIITEIRDIVAYK